MPAEGSLRLAHELQNGLSLKKWVWPGHMRSLGPTVSGQPHIPPLLVQTQFPVAAEHVLVHQPPLRVQVLGLRLLSLLPALDTSVRGKLGVLGLRLLTLGRVLLDLRTGPFLGIEL